MKTIIGGFLLMLGGWWFVLHAVRHPLNELALIQRAHIAPGFIVNAGEDVDFGDRNEAYWTHWVSYTYRTPDGREFAHSDSASGRLTDKLNNLEQPFPTDVEFLPENPNVNRIKGSGCGSVVEWLWRRVGLSACLLFVVTCVGIDLIRRGIKDVRQLRAARSARL